MIYTENKLSALVHQKAAQGGGKRCQFTFDKEVKRWRVKELFYQFSKGDSSQLISVDTSALDAEKHRTCGNLSALCCLQCPG